MTTSIPRQARPQRSLADLHTMTGAKESQAEPYKAFLRISFLELERKRHKREMLKVHRRVDAIAARCREIEREKARILASLREPSALDAPPAPDAGPATSPKRRRFQLTY